MFNKIKNIKAKEWLMLIVSMLFLTDILVLLNIPFLREIESFLFFTIIPGVLILQILRLNKMEFLKKAVLSVGLSLFFMIFAGLILNSFYPILMKPLSLSSVLISFNILLIALAIIAYMRNKDDFNLGDMLNFNFHLGGKLKSPLIFPLIFPFMAILGTYLMNTTQNNIILMLMLFMIPLYLVVVVYLNDKIHPSTYPIAVWLIGLSLLLMYGLTSSYTIGRDVHGEFYSFQLAMANLHWNIYDYYNPYNACLSVTILPVVYNVLSNIGGEYIFKLFYGIIGSAIPLIVYIVSKKYIGKKYAFFAALLFVFQLFFVSMLGAVRQEIAMLFFFLAVMVLFDSELDKKLPKKVLFLIFTFSLVVSHYTTAYVAFILMAAVLLVPFLMGLIKERKLVFTNFDLILISLAFIAVWYLLFAKVQFTAGAQVVGATAAAAATAGSSSGPAQPLTTTRGAYVLGVLGIVLKSLPNTVSVVVHDIIFATIMVGLGTVIWKYRYFKEKMEVEYLMGVAVSMILLILFVALPYISIAYDAARLFFQLLIFIAPLFVIGAITLAKLIKKPKWDVMILLVLLIALFSCATYMQYHFLGMPYSSEYDSNGLVRDETFIYGSELTSVSWLNYNKVTGLNAYSDGRESSRFALVYGAGDQNFKNSFIVLNSSFFAWNKTINSGYIYMGHFNVNDNKTLEIYDDISVQDINGYSKLFMGKYRIYDNGGSQIWM
ncbi:DUF2206 domain-containing protein [Methanobacterium paludis]|uniref:DUF2206 domain-containing protein n=1 Tax=Methanobacterium paludis (strain DSM 25820 / JCM 18151 / SWAN1) TaxID=868131 RepID=F6D2L8_METPW|nr:DUF2206 domain-containing protein [Methanobacterium paludis]AEG17952.1 Protein of unknown function DUF2206, membrane [Methanobacterium paludis]